MAAYMVEISKILQKYHEFRYKNRLLQGAKEESAFISVRWKFSLKNFKCEVVRWKRSLFDSKDLILSIESQDFA